ncbi:MAG: efflux RND transporter permease subunit, partial [Kangiellaceae bacterium]|nr:efflux RND transporter permease subunit [Kangiellaceae bacterium]
MNQIVRSFFLKVVEFPRTTIFLALISVLLFATGMPNLQISNDFRVYLSKDNPQLKAFEAFEDDYVKSDTATLVVTAKQGDIFTKDGLLLVEGLTADAWYIDYAYRVSSLTNYIYTRSQDDEIESNYLVEDASSLSRQQIAQIRKDALAENRLVKGMVTDDGKVGLVLITLNLPEDEANASIAVTEQVEQLRDKYRALYPNFQIDNGGSTTFNTTLARAVAADMSTLLPLSYLIIFTGLFLFLRSAIGSAAIFILISVCLLSTFGFFGWVAPVLTPIAGFAPSVLLSIMVADSVHILVTYYHQLHEGDNKKQAILASLELNFMPVLITSITTIIGFLSLNFSASPPYQDLGNMVAFGVLLALIFSLTLLPALMMVLPVGKAAKRPESNWFQPFANWVIASRKKLLIIMSLVTITLVTFIPNNRVSDNWANYFSDSFELVRLVKRLDGYLTGINALEYSMKPKPGYTIFSPEYLQQLDDFKDWLNNHPKVVKVNSLSELMKDLNQVMHDDSTEYFKVPESPELAAQYLL